MCGRYRNTNEESSNLFLTIAPSANIFQNRQHDVIINTAALIIVTCVKHSDEWDESKDGQAQT